MLVIGFLVSFWLMILFMSDWRIFHCAPILKAGIFPALHQRQMVWLVTPKNFASCSTPNILSSRPFIVGPFQP